MTMLQTLPPQMKAFASFFGKKESNDTLGKEAESSDPCPKVDNANEGCPPKTETDDGDDIKVEGEQIVLDESTLKGVEQPETPTKAAAPVPTTLPDETPPTDNAGCANTPQPTSSESEVVPEDKAPLAHEVIANEPEPEDKEGKTKVENEKANGSKTSTKPSGVPAFSTCLRFSFHVAEGRKIWGTSQLCLREPFHSQLCSKCRIAIPSSVMTRDVR